MAAAQARELRKYVLHWLQEPGGYDMRGEERSEGSQWAASIGPDVSFEDLISVDVTADNVQERDADFAALVSSGLNLGWIREVLCNETLLNILCTGKVAPTGRGHTHKAKPGTAGSRGRGEKMKETVAADLEAISVATAAVAGRRYSTGLAAAEREQRSEVAEVHREELGAFASKLLAAAGGAADIAEDEATATAVNAAVEVVALVTDGASSAWSAADADGAGEGTADFRLVASVPQPDEPRPASQVRARPCSAATHPRRPSSRVRGAPALI